jgi:hypothetical protein
MKKLKLIFDKICAEYFNVLWKKLEKKERKKKTSKRDINKTENLYCSMTTQCACVI